MFANVWKYSDLLLSTLLKHLWQRLQLNVFLGFSPQNWGKNERSKLQRYPWWKPALERSGPLTGVKVNLPTGQLSSAHSQDNAVVASGQVSECPWVNQGDPRVKPNRTRSPKYSCAATLPIQPDKAWEDLQRRIGHQIQVCPACSVIPKRTRGCNRCQKCFNKVQTKGSEYLQLKSEVYIHLSQIHLIWVKCPCFRSVRITTLF
jgi:hypothetical protein